MPKFSDLGDLVEYLYEPENDTVYEYHLNTLKQLDDEDLESYYNLTITHDENGSIVYVIPED